MTNRFEGEPRTEGELSRRKFLKYGILAATSCVGAILLPACAKSETKELTGNTEIINDPNMLAHYDLELETFESPEINALDHYRTELKKPITNELMLFIGLPNSTEEAKAAAINTAQLLFKFKEAEIRPLLVAETHTPEGQRPTVKNIQTNWSRYFNDLKILGVTDDMISTILLGPEANLPIPELLMTPEEYGPIMNTAIQEFRKVFPQATVGTLLDADTYDVINDLGWENPQQSLAHEQYLNSITEPIDIHYIQRFTFIREDLQRIDPHDFLRVENIIQTLQQKNIKHIGFNTGMHTSYIDGTTLTPEQQQIIAEQMVAYMDQFITAGFVLHVNLFCQNKLDGEGSNFNLIDDYEGSDQTPEMLQARRDTFNYLVASLQAKGVQVSLFDIA
jgi:hypothetical protein